MKFSNVGDYQFGFHHTLTGEQLASLARLIAVPAQRDESPLGGRGGVAIKQVPELGAVAVKRYVRGGILRIVNPRYYLRVGRVRPRIEFELLEKVRSFGVNAPEPVAFATKGALWYQGWLFMRAIPEHGRLTDGEVLNHFGAETLIHELARQVRLLIEHKLLHIDLHPGNVLVDRSGSVHVVDFDNARPFDGSERDLRDQYLRRWRRAVIKHNLPETLSELMAMELRQVAAQGS